MKKVIMLLTNPFEPDVRVYKEARSLTQNGFLVYIISWDRERKYPRFGNHNGILVERCQLKSSYGQGLRSILNHLLFHIYVILRLFKEKIDIIHCHDLDTLPVGFLLSKMKRCKIIYDAHEIDYFANLPKLVRSVFNNIEKFLCKRVDGILVTNEIQRKKFDSFIIDRERITEIRNCPFEDFFDEAKEKVGEEEHIVIAYIGYIQKGVGIEKTVRVFDTLCEHFPHLVLLLVGKVHPNFKMAFENLIQNSRNRDKIEVVGMVPYDQVKKYYRKSDISVILYENQRQFVNVTPTKLFEAMAHAIPVIASRVGDVEEILKDCHCGFIVDAEDDAKILGSMRNLIENPVLRHQMGHRGYLSAKEKFRWEIMERRLLAAYQRMNIA